MNQSTPDSIPPKFLGAHTLEIPEEAAGLGTPTHRFGIHTRRPVRSACLLTLLGVGFWVLEVFVLKMGIYGVGSILGFLLIGLAIFRLLLLFITRKNQVLIFPSGMSVTLQGQSEIFRWDAIDKIWQQRIQYRYALTPVYTIHNYIVQSKTGRRITIGRGFDRIAELGAIIQSFTTQHQLPGAIAALERGEMLDFGLFSIDHEGLHDGKKTIIWEDIQDVSVRHGSIEIQRRHGQPNWRIPNLLHVPNPHLFFTLTERFLGRQVTAAGAPGEARV
jgi:hypothetical protein